jgi:hypothetical protein
MRRYRRDFNGKACGYKGFQLCVGAGSPRPRAEAERSKKSVLEKLKGQGDPAPTRILKE